ncbi:MAG: pyridoxamine 5'-phosphate oxidase family protein [Desulfuromonadaceae bacterium]|nr:pyridoxamine 5'-phosphate oxidase family protein [Desulfuromonadaceae bacterium]
MDLKQLEQYFENAEGTGILSTCAADGKVNSALYARPRFFAQERIGFIMLGRLSYANLQSNPHAAYLFLERKEGYEGVRLHLRMVGEETDQTRIEQLMSELRPRHSDQKERHLVYFSVDKVLPLVGSGESATCLS